MPTATIQHTRCYREQMIPDHLETTNLTLRPFTEEDADAVYSYWQSDAGWERFNASVPTLFTPNDAQIFVKDMLGRSREDQPNWGIVHQDSVVGVVSLSFEQDHKVAVIGYGIHGDLRGQGLSAEAAQTVIKSAFKTYPKLQRIRAHTDAENVGSIRVLKKLGFLHEGTLRANQFVKGEFRDEAIFGLLRRDLISQSAND
jgi:RimJ/RimL family protein N-acetyltransferase